MSNPDWPSLQSGQLGSSPFGDWPSLQSGQLGSSPFGQSQPPPQDQGGGQGDTSTTDPNAPDQGAGLPNAQPVSGTDTSGALSGQPSGPLSGLFQNGVWQPAAAALGGSLLAARGNLGNAMANFGQQVPQLSANLQKRQALNNWLTAKSALSGLAAQSGSDPGVLNKAQNALNNATAQLYRADPELAQQIVAFQMSPHPLSFTTLPTGEVVVEDPYSGTVKPVYSPGGGAGNAATGMPAGFIFPTAKEFTDPSTGQKGLIDINGKKWITGQEAPSSDQAQSAGAAQLARQADNEVRKNQKFATSISGAAENALGNVPVAGGMVVGQEIRDYNAGKAQFLSAVRSLAVAAKLNPDNVEYSEEALFPKRGDGAAAIAQKDRYRAQIIQNLEQRAGVFAHQPQQQFQEGQTATGQNGQKIEFRAGQWVDPNTGMPVQ